MLDYARFIERWAGVECDAAVLHDFWSCHDYISANEAKAKRRYRAASVRTSVRASRTTEFIGGDYGIDNNDWGVSCFDCGIAPWGDS